MDLSSTIPRKIRQMSHCALQALVIEEVLMYAIYAMLVKLFAWQKIIAASQIHLRNRHRSAARLAPWRGNWLLI